MFRSALEVAKPALNGGHLAVLHGFRITAASGRVTVEASDIDMSIATSFPANVETDGDLVIPGRQLLAWLAKVPDGAVTVHTDDTGVNITAGTAAMSSGFIDVAEWPRRPEVTGAAVAIDEATWARVRGLRPFAGTDQPALCVIRLDADGVWATDSYMAAHLNAGGFPEASIPTAAVSAVDVDTELALTVDDRHGRIVSGDTVWTFNLSQAPFPQVARLIPNDGLTVELDVDRSELADALDRARALDPKSETPVLLVPKGDHLEVRLRIVDVASSVEHVDAGVTGTLAQVGFAPRRLLAMLKTSAAERVTLKGTDGLKPWVTVEDDLVVLLMPMRVA